jgi:hypothetical protein
VRLNGTPNASLDKAIMGNSNWANGTNTGWLLSSLGANREGKLKTNTGPRRDQGIAWKDGNWNLINPLFPALRSGHRHIQRPSPQKQIPAAISTS